MEDKRMYAESGKGYRAEILAVIRKSETADGIRRGLEPYHPYDIAAVLEELTEVEREGLWRALGREGMSEIVAYLGEPWEYLSFLSPEEAAEILEQMDVDDALEVLDELEESEKDELLDLMEDEEVKGAIRLIEAYEDDEFGSIMSPNFIAIPRGSTVKGAMRELISQAAERDNIYTIFVTEGDGSFYGALDLKELIVARSDTDLEKLIATAFPYVGDRESISENWERLRGYSEELIPVLSAEKKILGVITSSDLMELMDEELGEDYARLAALGSEEEPHESVWRSMRKRVPWLLILLVMGLAVSAVVGLFEGVVKELPAIVAFQSLILGMAGNVGTQSLAVTVRRLGTEERKKRQGRFALREMGIACLGGLVLGGISFLTVGSYLFVVDAYAPAFVLSTAGCVGIAMCFAMTVSGLTGAAIPLCLYRLKADPAVASGPLITTINDLVAVISYYGLAYILLLRSY